MKVYKIVVFILAGALLFGAKLEKREEIFLKPNFEFDSLNCRFVGNWPFGPSFAVAYDPQRNLAFCGSGGGVYILDVSNPSQPRKISEAIHSRGIVRDIFYLNNRLYLACYEAGLEIWDVGSPSSPQKLGSFNTPGEAFGVYVSGSYAYVADDWAGLQIYEFLTVGIEEECEPLAANRLSLEIYPNPAKSVINVQWSGKEKISLKIYDVSGKKVLEISPKQKEKVIRISLKGMKPGVYILQSGKRREKFVIAR